MRLMIILKLTYVLEDTDHGDKPKTLKEGSNNRTEGSDENEEPRDYEFVWYIQT